ncbi:lasso peptide biosynthesis B2 protein [Isoptericola sp. NPDC056573]|uniref:lasso peptide biosynthesis B2 protein n=1 Tax=Isoptericola sp. NPDC056573 TaxID=3345868 RepID=UPI0036738F68
MIRVPSAARWFGRVPVALGAAGTVVVVEALLRTTRLPRTARVMGAPLASAQEASAAPVAALRLTAAEARRLRAVGRVLRLSPFGSTCLRRALCAGHVLRGRDPRLVVGVAKHDGVVSAHAWLVVDGVNLDPDGSADFLPLSLGEGAVPA